MKKVTSTPVERRNLCIEFILNRAYENKSFKTLKGYAIDIIQFMDYLDRRGKKLHEVTGQDIERYKNYLTGRGCNLSPKSANRKLMAIRSLLKDNKLEILVKPIKIQEQQYLDNVLTIHEIDRLISSSDDLRDRAIILTLLKTGVRVSELIQFKISDIGKSEKKILGKGGKYRDILIDTDVNRVWKEYLKIRKNTHEMALFTGTRGALQVNSINKIIKKNSSKAHVKADKIHAHNFRHAFCKLLSAQGNDIGTIADLAGHKSVETTRIYTRKSRTELRKEIKGMYSYKH